MVTGVLVLHFLSRLVHDGFLGGVGLQPERVCEIASLRLGRGRAACRDEFRPGRWSVLVTDRGR